VHSPLKCPVSGVEPDHGVADETRKQSCTYLQAMVTRTRACAHTRAAHARTPRTHVMIRF
jgi:hypothetical protein